MGLSVFKCNGKAEVAYFGCKTGAAWRTQIRNDPPAARGWCQTVAHLLSMKFSGAGASPTHSVVLLSKT